MEAGHDVALNASNSNQILSQRNLYCQSVYAVNRFSARAGSRRQCFEVQCQQDGGQFAGRCNQVIFRL